VKNKNLPGYVLLHAGAVPPAAWRTSERFFCRDLPGTAMQAEGKPSSIYDPADKDPRIQPPNWTFCLQQDGNFCNPADPTMPSIAIRITKMAYKCSRWCQTFSTGKESEATKRLYGLDAGDKTNGCTVCNACRAPID